jgi:hypothetical protein
VGADNKKKHGNYPPDLDKRIDKFVSSFTPRQSVVLFYANYDNPVSADEMRYLLLGCFVIVELPRPAHFSFTKDELKQWRAKWSLKKLDDLIAMTWRNRGLYPGLCAVLGHFLEDQTSCLAIATAICKTATAENDLLHLLRRIAAGDIPAELEEFEDDLLDLGEVRQFKKNIDALARLSLLRPDATSG